MQDYFRCRDRANGWMYETQEDRDLLSRQELDARILELNRCYATFLHHKQLPVPPDPNIVVPVETRLNFYATELDLTNMLIVQTGCFWAGQTRSRGRVSVNCLINKQPTVRDGHHRRPVLEVGNILFTVRSQTEAPMTNQQAHLCERLQRLGFTAGTQMKLFGEVLDFLSDPIALADDVVLLDAKERKSGQTRRVRVPYQ
jgi:hypothetical protein